MPVTAYTDNSACPTVDHARLLLTLLGTSQPAETPQKGARDDVVALSTPPGLIVLWNMGRMFMEQTEEDENIPPDAAANETAGEWKFKLGYVSNSVACYCTCSCQSSIERLHGYNIHNQSGTAAFLFPTRKVN
jgi:hypothetical protein